MNYSIQIKRSASKELARIPGSRRAHLIAAIDRLSEQPFIGESLKGKLRGLRRIRVGTYRVVYEILDKALVVLVVRVSHRQSAYRAKRK